MFGYFFDSIEPYDSIVILKRVGPKYCFSSEFRVRDQNLFTMGNMQENPQPSSPNAVPSADALQSFMEIHQALLIRNSYSCFRPRRSLDKASEVQAEASGDCHHRPQALLQVIE